LATGGRNAKGYLSGIRGFLDSGKAQSNQAEKVQPVEISDGPGVSIGQSTASPAHQLFELIGPVVNETTQYMRGLLETFHVHETSISPFALEFGNLPHLRTTLASFFASSESMTSNVEKADDPTSAVEDDAIVNSLAARVRKVLNITKDIDVDDAISHTESLDAILNSSLSAGVLHDDPTL
jgi:hypothetical protein